MKGTHRDAQRTLAKMLAEADAGSLCDPSKMTLGAYIEQSLDAAHELAPKTRERYAEIAARWVAPYLKAAMATTAARSRSWLLPGMPSFPATYGCATSRGCAGKHAD